MPNTKAPFLPIDKFYMIRKIQISCLVIVHGLTFIMKLNVSFSSHSPHIAQTFSMHVSF